MIKYKEAGSGRAGPAESGKIEFSKHREESTGVYSASVVPLKG
jgi:hypothetical protein